MHRRIPINARQPGHEQWTSLTGTHDDYVDVLFTFSHIVSVNFSEAAQRDAEARARAAHAREQGR